METKEPQLIPSRMTGLQQIMSDAIHKHCPPGWMISVSEGRPNDNDARTAHVTARWYSDNREYILHWRKDKADSVSFDEFCIEAATALLNASKPATQPSSEVPSA